MAPKAKAQLAREHLERALPTVIVGEYTEAVTWLFAALESAIVAIAEVHGMETKQQHWKKAEVAHQLYVSGDLPCDFSETLAILNYARKSVIYEGEEPDFEHGSLEDIPADVERAVRLAEAVGR